MITIRRVNDADAETLSELLCASIRELCAADHKNDPERIEQWTANKTPAHLAHWISDPRRSLYLAERDGQTAGIGCIGEDGDILLNYVAPANRFCGVSRVILAHLEATLTARGFARAKLTSTETAHRFYREAGWMDTGETETLFGLRGYPMVKDLQSTTYPRP